MERITLANTNITNDPHYKLYKFILENLKTLKQFNGASQADLNNLKNELNTRINQLQGSSASASDVAQDIANLQSQINNLASKADLDKLKADFEDLKKKLADLTADKQELEDELNKVNSIPRIEQKVTIKVGSIGVDGYAYNSGAKREHQAQIKNSTPSFKVIDTVYWDESIYSFTGSTHYYLFHSLMNGKSGTLIGVYVPNYSTYLKSTLEDNEFYNPDYDDPENEYNLVWFKAEDCNVTNVNTLELEEEPEISEYLEIILDSNESEGK